MVRLSYLNAIFNNLKLRNVQYKPYTRVADIMIALNPYQWLDELYSEETRGLYAQELIWKATDRDPKQDLDPHVYEVATLAYKGMAVDRIFWSWVRVVQERQKR